MSEIGADPSAFCARLGLDETAVRAALASRGGAPRTPVYVQALLAIGGWVAAILVIAFVLTLLTLVVDIDFEQAAPVIILAAVLLFAAGAAQQRDRPADGFGHHFAGALVAAGALLAPVAVGIKTESFWAAAFAAALAAVASALLTRDRPAQFLAAALALGLVAAGFVAAELPGLVELAALATVLGAVLILYPPRIDLGPIAAVLLLFLPGLMVVLIQGAFSIGFGLGAAALGIAGLGARVILGGLLIWLLHTHRRLAGATAIDERTAFVGAVLFSVALLMPPGGSAALVLMMLGFVLGRRGLAAIGTLFQIYFVSRFYYDLDATLLAKSLILMAVGVIVLAAYALVVRGAAEAGR